jgi:hypothetical protein
MAIVNRRFATILAKMSSTFNRVSVTDTSGKNFFDFYPDMPRNAFGAAGSREYNLSASGADKQSIYFLMTEEDKFPGISMDPVHAYDEEVPAPSDLNLDGQVTYKGLNSVPAIGATKKLMTQVFGARWATNKPVHAHRPCLTMACCATDRQCCATFLCCFSVSLRCESARPGAHHSTAPSTGYRRA